MKSEKLKEFEYIFNPKAVAVIGASQTDDFTNSLIRTKMREYLFLVNPKRKELLGKKCYPTILDIEHRIDYAVIAVPALLVPKVLSECIEKGVKAAHIFSAGFSELPRLQGGASRRISAALESSPHHDDTQCSSE